MRNAERVDLASKCRRVFSRRPTFRRRPHPSLNLRLSPLRSRPRLLPTRSLASPGKSFSLITSLRGILRGPRAAHYRSPNTEHDGRDSTPISKRQRRVRSKPISKSGRKKEVSAKNSTLASPVSTTWPPCPDEKLTGLSDAHRPKSVRDPATSTRATGGDACLPRPRRVPTRPF